MSKATPEIRAEIQEIIDRMTTAMQMRDIDVFMKICNSVDGGAYIGLQKDDISVGTASLRSSMSDIFKDLESLNIKFGWNSIQASPDGNTAWMTANSTMTMKKPGFEPLAVSMRMTFIFEKNTEGQFLVSHLHYSSPVTLDFVPLPEPEVTPENKASTETEGTSSDSNSDLPNDDGVFYDIP